MSAMNAYVTTDYIMIVTDTYCYEIGTFEEELPLNFVTKVYLLPHLNCCFCTQGFGELGLSYFKFVQQYAIADDLSSLISYTKQKFTIHHLPDLIKYRSDIGTIFLFGLNDSSKSLETYKIRFEYLSLKVEKLYDLSEAEPSRIITKPGLKTNDLDWSNKQSVLDSLIEVIHRQKIENDNILSTTKKVGIGGSIQVTYMLLNEAGLQFHLFKSEDFADKAEHYSQMIKRSQL